MWQTHEMSGLVQCLPGDSFDEKPMATSATLGACDKTKCRHNGSVTAIVRVAEHGSQVASGDVDCGQPQGQFIMPCRMWQKRPE
jgi:hypothetical protein